VPAALKAVLNSWGPGKFDPRANKETYTAEGPVSYWNGYVAVTQMHGQGSFSDARLGINVVQTPDLVTPKLPALRHYQLSLTAPKPDTSAFDSADADRGKTVFNGSANCATCHAGATYSDVNTGRLHAAIETGMDRRYAAHVAEGVSHYTAARAAPARTVLSRRQCGIAGRSSRSL
jgi:hypothetical protein